MSFAELQLPQRLLLGRRRALSPMGVQHSSPHAHAAARLPQCKLHETQPIRQMFPQRRKDSDAAQSFPARLFRRWLYVVRRRT